MIWKLWTIKLNDLRKALTLWVGVRFAYKVDALFNAILSLFTGSKVRVGVRVLSVDVCDIYNCACPKHGRWKDQYGMILRKHSNPWAVRYAVINCLHLLILCLGAARKSARNSWRMLVAEKKKTKPDNAKRRIKKICMMQESNQCQFNCSRSWLLWKEFFAYVTIDSMPGDAYKCTSRLGWFLAKSHSYYLIYAFIEPVFGIFNDTL